MLAILEYKAGNQTSVRRALEHLGIPCRITADPAELEQAQGIIFPGVGAAGQAMEALTSAGLDSVLRRAVAEGQPLLGICLGCQILLEHSEENDVRTLGIVPGRCVRFPDHMKEEDGSPAPVPHMAGTASMWCVRAVCCTASSPVRNSISSTAIMWSPRPSWSWPPRSTGRSSARSTAATACGPCSAIWKRAAVPA